MDAQNMNITATESETEGVNTLSTPKMTKEEAQQKSDAELLQMIQQAQGHTGKDFSDYMNCDFSYTYLTGLIRDRGYENGWHKTSEGSSPVVKPLSRVSTPLSLRSSSYIPHTSEGLAPNIKEV